MSRDLGDFQTPPALVSGVLDYLQGLGREWPRVLEPTCGRGNFITGLLALPSPPREIQGIELQASHVANARSVAQDAKACQVIIHQANIFGFHLGNELRWRERGPLLVVGNPPWVTSAELGTLGSRNLPRKRNLKNLPGFEAMTGGSNFDIAEYIWLKLMRELADEQPTIALLCKTAVARNVLQYVAANDLPIGNANIRKIDAKQWFGAAVDACLFCVDITTNERQYKAHVYADLRSATPISTIGVIGGQLVSNVEMRAGLKAFDGISPLTWRQGLKHDAASAVELVVDLSGQLRNRLGEVVNVEPAYVYPLLKSSDLVGKGKTKPMRAAIVPQQRLGEGTHHLKQDAPLLWSYLIAHRHLFEQRKSSIYRNQPSFAYFGLGDYTFAPYKVAISGMYKTPVFRAIAPVDGRPVMFDDTCYFLACASSRQAAIVVSLLNDPVCLDLLSSIAFWDAKRPITKKLLQRIDLLALLRHTEREPLLDRANIELARLESKEGQGDDAWPVSLEDLITGSAGGAVSGSTRETDVVQLTLLGAF